MSSLDLREIPKGLGVGYPSTTDILSNVVEKMTDQKKNLFLDMRQATILGLRQVAALHNSGETYLYDHPLPPAGMTTWLQRCAWICW